MVERQNTNGEWKDREGANLIRYEYDQDRVYEILN